MDPEQAYKDALAALKDWHAIDGTDYTQSYALRLARYAEAGQRLVDAFEALNGWIAMGGYLPKAWQRWLEVELRERARE